jgi:uncharacterized protein YacL
VPVSLALKVMEQQRRVGIGFQISTAFLVLSLFCLMLEWVPQSSIPHPISEFLHHAFSYPLVAIVFGEYGPIWALIAAIFAIARLIRHRKELFPVVQHVFEVVLCVIAVILFPAY